MDLQKYFASLGDALVAGGMSKAQSKAYCKRLMETLQKLDEKTLAEKLEGYGSPENLAQKVLAIASKQASTEPAANPSAESPAAEAPAATNPALEHTVNVDSTVGKSRPASTVTRPVPVVHGSEEKTTEPEADPEPPTPKKKQDPVQTQEEAVTSEKKPISKRGMQIFWWSTGLSSPITIALAAVLAGLFILAYAALIFAAVALIVAVTVTVVVGILLAIVCLGYGIVEMLPGTDAFFVGLYEFGLGMIVVGATIVFPILEYNAATKLVPYCIKKLTVFLKFTVRQIKRLVIYLYDLCRDL